MADEIRIDWGSATVDGGRLSVPLAPKPSPEFKARLTDVIERLRRGGSGWGEIKVTKSEWRVDSVADGAEGELRHFVESAILQANANLAAGEEDDEDGGAGEERSEDDQRRTDAFRAFSDETPADDG